jgi:hypothetical protein
MDEEQILEGKVLIIVTDIVESQYTIQGYCETINEFYL